MTYKTCCLGNIYPHTVLCAGCPHRAALVGPADAGKTEDAAIPMTQPRAQLAALVRLELLIEGHRDSSDCDKCLLVREIMRLRGDQTKLLDSLKARYSDRSGHGGVVADWELIHAIDSIWPNPWPDRSPPIEKPEDAYRIYDLGKAAKAAGDPVNPYDAEADAYGVWNAGFDGVPASYEIREGVFIQLAPDLRGERDEGLTHAR